MVERYSVNPMVEVDNRRRHRIFGRGPRATREEARIMANNRQAF
jgi:hypothetical protein